MSSDGVSPPAVVRGRRWRTIRRAPLLVGFVAAVLALTTSPAFAQATEEPTIEDSVKKLTDNFTSINIMWIIIGAALVIFMQAGFALVETGFCRAKHAAHVVGTNFAIFGLGFVAFYLVGYAFAFGGYSYPGYFGYDQPVGDALIGSGNWVFLWKGGFALSGQTAMSAAVMAFFLYMVAFMDTVATIPTGSMAERWKWKSFVVWGLFCGAIYYPIFAAWTWGGGWLAKTWDTMGLGAGYVDFAGSGVVHAVGGVAALAGALVLGPRLGKYGPDGKPRALSAHNIPMAMLGTFILLFGWFGFNAASTLDARDSQLAVVATNTAIAAAFGATIGMAWSMFRFKGKADPGMMANGMLAGLVAITAPCAFIDPWAAAVIGTVAAVVCFESVLFIERKLKIDDPVGAISVHGVCGIFGVLALGLFANGDYGAAWNGSSVTGVTGLFYGDASQLGAQALGSLVICTVIFGVAYAFFAIQNKLTKGGIRSSEHEELTGLDEHEMGVAAYVFVDEEQSDPIPVPSNGDGSTTPEKEPVG
ncbi:MAG: ammonium transporter [Acidimicrobiia bacterium]